MLPTCSSSRPSTSPDSPWHSLSGSAWPWSSAQFPVTSSALPPIPCSCLAESRSLPLAIIVDAAAYRKREATAKATTTRGIVLSLVAGVLMGSFYPLVAHAMRGSDSPGPYAIAFFFAIGVLISTDSRQPLSHVQAP